MSNPSEKSIHEPMEKPDIKADIPPYLLEGATEQDKYIIERLSYLSQHAIWSEKAHLNTHAQLRYTNGSVMENKAESEKLKKKVEELESQAGAISPFIKPITYFSKLWEIRLFRWVFTLGVLFIILILYPYYLQHPFTDWLKVIIAKFIGTP